MFTRGGSQQNLWLAKLSFLSCVDYVTHHSQFTATAQLQPQKEHHQYDGTSMSNIWSVRLTLHHPNTYSKSIDGCDDGLPHGGHSVPVSQEVPTVTLLEGSVLHLLNVSTGCEKTRVDACMSPIPL